MKKEQVTLLSVATSLPTFPSKGFILPLPGWITCNGRFRRRYQTSPWSCHWRLPSAVKRVELINGGIKGSCISHTDIHYTVQIQQFIQINLYIYNYIYTYFQPIVSWWMLGKVLPFPVDPYEKAVDDLGFWYRSAWHSIWHLTPDPLKVSISVSTTLAGKAKGPLLVDGL